MTVTDQNGKQRQSVTDALGRLTEVYEDPAGLNYLTSYSYDVLDGLLTVSQGVQTRSFVYDSLKRLTAATNPESGTVSYQYDNNGNLTLKTDARSITTTFSYDALNRATLKNYSDATPDLAYFYDNAPLPAGAPSFERGSASGRLVAVTYGGASEGTYRGYDAMGRVMRQYQRTEAVNYLVEASYYPNGALQTETYPAVPGAGDRRTITYTNDAAGRLASLSSVATSYAPAASVSGIGYAPHSALTGETYGNNLVHAVTYNNRRQPNEIKLGTSGAPTSVLSLAYNYGTTNNNGNVQSISYAGGGLSYTQTFGYDQLNRLTTSQEGASWSQTNSYDRYGNRSIVGGVLSFNAGNNRITGWSYDAAGNLLNDGIHSYTYDAENKISKVDAVPAYVYDGEGQRVRKLLGENLRFVYGLSGQLIAEFNGSAGTLTKEYIYGGSGLVATIEPTAVNANGTRYTTSDHLGSARVVTNSGAGVVSRRDYMPFGEELGAGIGGRTTGMGFSAADGLRQKFTSYERDNETGLDFAQARYYGSTQGRFTSADPLLSSGELHDPQTWNRYAYVLNNPLLYTDPTGLFVYGKNVTDEQKKQFEAALNKAKGYLNKIAETYGKNSNEYKKAERALNSYGKPGEDNGVTVIANDKIDAGKTTLNNKAITVAFNPNQFENNFFQALVGHEGSHVADAQNYLATGKSPTEHQFEYDGHSVQSVLGEMQAKEMNYVNFYINVGGSKNAPEQKVDLWNKSWEAADKATLRDKAISQALAISKKDTGYPSSTQKAFSYNTTEKEEKMKAILFALLFFVCFPSLSYVHAQRKATNKARSTVRLVKDKPSVYITFERKGKRGPLDAGESNVGIWLRLHNNTRWDISFCASGVPEEYGEVGMYYEVEEIPFQESGGSYAQAAQGETLAKIEKREIPPGHRIGHVCHVYKLLSGKSLVFSVPREHLAENLAIKVAFNYGWEESEDSISGLEPHHSVYFYATSLWKVKNDQ